MLQRIIDILLAALAALQWVGCLWLFAGAVQSGSTFVAWLAIVAIIFTVFTDWVAWKVKKAHA